MYKRKLYYKIKNKIKDKEIIVITGMRRVGKTTILRMIFIEEMQIKPDITKVVKYLYDHYNVKFFLTGSSSFYLKNLFPESLAGRKVIFELYPLDFEEFLLF